MCLYPRIIMNPKYKPNQKNGGIVPPLHDTRTLGVPIGCGKCMECRKQKSREWAVRLQEDIREKQNIQFVTLTLSNESITEIIKYINEKTKIKIEGYELDNLIATITVRRYLERWRKKYKKSIKHWLVTELGHNGTENIHLHGLIYTDKKEEIEKIWQYGWVYIGEYVNEQTINYIIKYISKIDDKHKTYNPKILTSKGIGKKYMERIDSKNNKFKGEETREYYQTRTGHKLSLPMYYRNKIYNDNEKEQLWINKLDKEERWVNGIKIDTKEGITGYLNALKETQNLNKRLGYGDNEINWKQKEYEKQRRIVMMKKRTEHEKIEIIERNEYEINNNNNFENEKN